MSNYIKYNVYMYINFKQCMFVIVIKAADFEKCR